jgi:hypothetical protein
MTPEQFQSSVAQQAAALIDMGAQKYITSEPQPTRSGINDDDWYLICDTTNTIKQQVGCSTIMARCIAHGQEEDGGTWMRGMAAKSKLFPL